MSRDACSGFAASARRTVHLDDASLSEAAERVAETIRQMLR